ncbi:MAG TPA: hypothetical protein VJV04_12370 [Nitrospiraceae bacterium]|nr:hypothetical protein [Nitrospiraceae bacterium]
MEIPMESVRKQVREFIRAADVLLQQINENGEFNGFEMVLLSCYAARLNSANTILQSKALMREAKNLRQSRKTVLVQMPERNDLP